ncbi:MAG: hypothetical protein QOH41_923 [Blastocatellia bacterium]|nr:hypothetical protein [Blastocatellia bacterium]
MIGSCQLLSAILKSLVVSGQLSVGLLFLELEALVVYCVDESGPNQPAERLKICSPLA